MSNFLILGVAHAEGDVLEVEEQGDLALVVGAPRSGDGDDDLARLLVGGDHVAVGAAAHPVGRAGAMGGGVGRSVSGGRRGGGGDAARRLD